MRNLWGWYNDPAEYEKDVFLAGGQKGIHERKYRKVQGMSCLGQDLISCCCHSGGLEWGFHNRQREK